MTVDQVIKRMTQNTEANNWDLIYNWIRQGEIQNKTFKQLMAKMLESEQDKQAPSYQDRYAENRRLVQEELKKTQKPTNPGGGKKKKSS